MRRHRRPLVLLAPQLRARDDFTDADTTVLESHRPTSEGSWTKHGHSGAGSITIDANRVHNTNDTVLHTYYHSWVPGSADYDVEADVVVRSFNTSVAGPAARIVTGANTYYVLRYNAAPDAWQLFKFVAGAATQLGSDVVQVLTVDQPYRATLALRGSQITALVDGVPIIAVTDDAITAPGRAGLTTQLAAAATTGVHLDAWRVRA